MTDVLKTVEPNHFVTDASALGWKPGEVRTFITTPEHLFEFDYTLRKTDDLDSEIIYWNFIDRKNGSTVVVYND